MVTGELKSQIDKVWNAFWTGGIANPVEVIEQITYLLFIKRLDELHTKEENKANRLGVAIVNRVFPEGYDDAARTPRPYNELRWSVFANRDSSEMFEILGQHVFPFLQQLGEVGSSYARNMKDARFTIPTPALLVKVVDLLNDISMDDRDTKGDVYEYMLSKLATAGTNGQFRTPRHIIKLMVDMSAPTPEDTIIDPAAGTAGFLMMAGEYLHDHHPEIWADAARRDHHNQAAFTGYDSDAAMARIGSMNLLLHGVENPTMERADSLAETHPKTESYSLVLANPPFAGSLDYETTAKDLLQVVRTKKTELLFLALTLRLLKNGGRAAVIVPDGVLFGSSKAHKDLRRMIIDDHKLDAVVKLPSGVFKPYAGVSTAILFFTKTSSGGTDNVWFYDVQAEGFSLDDKRTELDAAVHAQNNLPDVLARWSTMAKSPDAELARPRTAQSFMVSKSEIVAQGYDLSINRYKEVAHEVVVHRPPKEILDDLAVLDVEIAAGTAELRIALGVDA
ncbi:DNA methyltransferase [Cryobacterium sp. LW097]|uniref:type I restriction-modification system subunit M n=1 Tax=Cryobacterium sp. LW097 TaxID=1978566 RepID=UPI000B4D59FA|nr:class I SAM-dependent DNA methyltransferase [Cryobacterium sp. LW097]ASD22833.1 DNA methyltransferase [Cryobacterium sp. LW097]